MDSHYIHGYMCNDYRRCGQLFSVLFLATYNEGDVGKGEISGDICQQGLQLL